MVAYAGPIRDEPLAVELANTRYAMRGRPADGLSDPEQRAAWLEALAARLPGDLDPRRAGELLGLRDAVRRALGAVIEGAKPAQADLAAISRAAHGAPRSAGVRCERAVLVREDRVHASGPTDVLLGAFAADAVELLTGPSRDRLRACHAPGCVLLFVKDHPRRAWCSNACGNRTRAARHYARHR